MGMCILAVSALHEIPVFPDESRYPTFNFHIQLPGVGQREQAIPDSGEDELGAGLRNGRRELADGAVQQFGFRFREPDGDGNAVGMHIHHNPPLSDSTRRIRSSRLNGTPPLDSER